jgi:hypothetical protein
MIEIESIAIIGAAAFAGALIVQLCFFNWMRRGKASGVGSNVSGSALEKAGCEQEKEWATLCQRLNEMEDKISKVESRNSPEIHSPTGPSYEIAMDLVRMGASRNELMFSCGLIRAEADLIIAVYGGQKNSANSSANSER